MPDSLCAPLPLDGAGVDGGGRSGTYAEIFTALVRGLNLQRITHTLAQDKHAGAQTALPMTP